MKTYFEIQNNSENDLVAQQLEKNEPTNIESFKLEFEKLGKQLKSIKKCELRYSSSPLSGLWIMNPEPHLNKFNMNWKYLVPKSTAHLATTILKVPSS